MGLVSCNDIIRSLVILCIWQIKGVISGAYCNSKSSFYSTGKYCIHGCCSDAYDGCCDNVHVIHIIAIVIGSLVGIVLVVSCIICLCCVCNKRQRSRGQVLQNSSQVVYSQNTVQTSNIPYGYAYPMAQTSCPQNPAPSTTAYPSTQPQPEHQPQPQPEHQPQPQTQTQPPTGTQSKPKEPEHVYSILNSSSPPIEDTENTYSHLE